MELTATDAKFNRKWVCLASGESRTGFNTTGGKLLCGTVPKGTKAAKITVRGATLVLTSDGTAPSATLGLDYGVRTEPYDIDLRKEELELVKGFSAGAAVVYIEYYGVK